MSYVDEIFIENCRNIIVNGTSTEGQEVRAKWEDGTPAHTMEIFGVMNRYDISKGLPLFSIRKTNYKAAIEEVLWIWQKKSSNVNDLKTRIWDSWANEYGSIGKAYGYQIGKPFTYKGKLTDQTEFVLDSIINNPTDRGIVTNIFVHEDLDEMGLRPCVYGTQWYVSNGKLNLLLQQRSQDTAVANNWNIVQYAALLMAFARHTGLECGELIHCIGSMHIYDRHLDIVQDKLMNVDPYKYVLPRTILNPDKKNFYDITPDDFIVDNYHYEYGVKDIKFPVAI